MAKESDLGIYVKKTKEFYYLEYGENYVKNTLDRVKKTLMQRNTISNLTTQGNRDIQYEVMSYKEAYQNDIKMVPIYISKHIQSLFQKSKTNSNKGNFK